MRIRNVVLGLFLGSLALVMGSLHFAPAQADPACPGGIEVSGPGPVKHCTKDGVINEICFKAGKNVYKVIEDGKYDCYEVKGIGTDCVEVTGGGTGRDCKDISNVRFYVDSK